MSDEAEIRHAVEVYLDGLHEGDTEKLRASFHPTSALTTVVDGELTAMSLDEWCALVEGRPSPSSEGLDRHDEIVLVDQASPTTALAKVKCAIPPRFFTDYLSLLKVAGEWKVAQKVYATRADG